MTRCRTIFATVPILALCTLFQAAQSATVADLAGEVGLPAPLPSNGESVVFDYDGDGDHDILLSGHGQEWPLLQQGPSGLFARALPGSFATAQDRHGCTTGDYDADGRPDLYCVRGACMGICTSPYPNELYLQRPDRTFEKIAGARGADDPLTGVIGLLIAPRRPIPHPKGAVFDARRVRSMCAGGPWGMDSARRSIES